MPKLTKTLVENEKPIDKERFVWDTEMKGFGLKVFPSGAKSFVYQYRTPEGQSKRTTIGKLSDALTVDQARQKAKLLTRDVLNGRDPQGEKQAARLAITVDELLDAYLASESFANKAESTKSVDVGRINRHLRPLLGKSYADKLTPEAIKKAHRAITEGKTAATIKTKARGQARVLGGQGTADKAVLILSAAYKWAVEQGIAKNNPAAKLGNWKSGTRDAVLDNAEDYARLFATLQTMENEKRMRQAAADAIRFIALTGARRGEALGLRWSYVDLKNGQVILPPKAHKAGHKSGKPRIIAMPTQAQAIIARQPAGEPDAYVFRASKGDGPISLNKPWQQVRAEARLPADLGLHGLRHSIATHLAMAGASAVELMEVMGHRQIATTMRYIHFAENARSTLAERAAAVALAGMNGTTEQAEVVPIRKGLK